MLDFVGWGFKGGERGKGDELTMTYQRDGFCDASFWTCYGIL